MTPAPPVTWPVFAEVVPGWLQDTTFDAAGTATTWTIYRPELHWTGEARTGTSRRTLFGADTGGHHDDRARIAESARAVARTAARKADGMLFRPVD